MVESLAILGILVLAYIVSTVYRLNKIISKYDKALAELLEGWKQ